MIGDNSAHSFHYINLKATIHSGGSARGGLPVGLFPRLLVLLSQELLVGVGDVLRHAVVGLLQVLGVDLGPVVLADGVVHELQLLLGQVVGAAAPTPAICSGGCHHGFRLEFCVIGIRLKNNESYVSFRYICTLTVPDILRQF